MRVASSGLDTGFGHRLILTILLSPAAPFAAAHMVLVLARLLMRGLTQPRQRSSVLCLDHLYELSGQFPDP